MKWVQHGLLFAIMGGLYLAPLSSFAALPFFSQDRNYINWISSLIYADLFITDPTLAVEQGTAPKLEVFLVQNQKCVDETKPLSYRLLVKNIGDVVAHDLFITSHYINASLQNTQRPADDHDTAQQTIIWAEPALIPGDFMSFTFSLAPNTTLPLTIESAVEYTHNEIRRTSVTSHSLDTICSSEDTFAPGDLIKRLWQ